MLVIKKKRFIFVFIMFVLLLLLTCICSYYFISHVDTFSPAQRKFVAENMIFSQKELTTYYGDPSIKNSLIGQLDSKVAALHQGLDQVKQHDL